MNKQKIASCLLRAGLAFVFLYAAIASFLNPSDWVAYLPTFLTNLFPAAPLLTAFSIYELLLAAWLIIGKKTFYAAALSTLTMIGIIFSNFSILDVVFRDVAIFFAALALAVLER